MIPPHESLYIDGQVGDGILEMMKATVFFRLMCEAKLPLDTYAEYLAQEAIFLDNAARLYRRAFERMKVGVGQEQNEIFATFFWERYQYFSNQLELFTSGKKVSPKPQEANAALKLYMSSLETVIAEDKDLKFLPVAFLHRDWLYGTLAGVKLEKRMRNVCGKDWSNSYKRFDESLTFTEMFFDKTYEKGHDKLYLNIFHHNALQALNFFRALSNEPALTMEEIKDKYVYF